MTDKLCRGSIGRRPFIASGLGALAAGALPGRTRAGGRDVPYFSARSDMDSTLACARMAMSNFDRSEHYPVDDLRDMLYHREGHWIFEAQLVPILDHKELGPTLHSTTPYKKLMAGKGGEVYGPGAASKIDRKALEWASGFLNGPRYREEAVPLEQALEWHDMGALIILGVDRKVLRNDPGLPYCRYNVVLAGARGGRVFFHDPVAGPDRSLPLEAMKRAYENNGNERTLLGAMPPKPE